MLAQRLSRAPGPAASGARGHVAVVRRGRNSARTAAAAADANASAAAAAAADANSPPHVAATAIVAALSAGELDALLEYVPDAQIDAAIAAKRRQQEQQDGQGPKPNRRTQTVAPTFLDLLAACGDDCDDAAAAAETWDHEAAADAEAWAAAGDDEGDAVQGLLPLTALSISLERDAAHAAASSSPSRRRRRPYFDRLARQLLVEQRPPPTSLSVLSMVRVSARAYRVRVRVVYGGGSSGDAVAADVTLSLAEGATLEPSYRGAPKIRRRWWLTGAAGEERREEEEEQERL
jgi:hypothetical protein